MSGLRKLGSSARRSVSSARALSTSVPPSSSPLVDASDRSDRRDPISPKDDPVLYVFGKGYNSARDKCMDGTFCKGKTTETDIEDFVKEIIPTINGVDLSEEDKKNTVERGVRQALEQLQVISEE